MRKTFSLPEKYADYIKEKAEKFEIAESDALRRILDNYMAQEKKNQHDNIQI